MGGNSRTDVAGVVSRVFILVDAGVVTVVEVID